VLQKDVKLLKASWWLAEVCLALEESFIITSGWTTKCGKRRAGEERWNLWMVASVSSESGALFAYGIAYQKTLFGDRSNQYKP